MSIITVHRKHAVSCFHLRTLCLKYPFISCLSLLSQCSLLTCHSISWSSYFLFVWSIILFCCRWRLIHFENHLYKALSHYIWVIPLNVFSAYICRRKKQRQDQVMFPLEVMSCFMNFNRKRIYSFSVCSTDCRRLSSWH